MSKVLFLAPTLTPSGTTARLTLLADALPALGVTARVLVLGAHSPAVERLRGRRVPVDVIPWTRVLDAGPVRAVRKLVGEFGPALVHAWGPACFRVATLAALPAAVRLSASGLLGPDGSLPWYDRVLLRQTTVVAFGAEEVARYRAAGVGEGPVAVWPQAVAAAAAGRPRPAGAPPGPYVLVPGPQTPHRGGRDAIWAFDIFHFARADLHLVLLGGGVHAGRLEGFVRTVEMSGYAHFPGEVDDVGPWLEHAAVVWVPAVRPGGANSVLEAQAAGRPIVATRVGALPELITDGESGVLVPPGDKPGLARRTFALIEDGALATRLGEAGRARALAQTPAALAHAVAQLVNG